jgi:ribokinase
VAGHAGQGGHARRAGHAGRVVVVGAVNLDLIMRLPALPQAGQTVLGGQLTRSAGGKGANQAVAAARAGARAHLIAAVGADDGGPSVAALAADGVNVAAVARQAAPTGHAFVLVDDAGENQIAVASGANDLLSAGDVLAALGDLRLTAADVVVLSFEAPTTALQAAAGAAAEAGCQVVVNPAPARPRSLDLLAGAIVTPNVHELAALTTDLPDLPGPPGAADGPTAAGRPGLASPEPAVAALAAGLARHTGGPVVVTLGPAGALLAGPVPGAPLHVAGHRVAVRDTTGAGDTFTGVLAASLAAGELDLAGCVRRAVAASALAVTADGARTRMPTAAQIDALLAAS